ncbi:MAG TPA: DoxX family protein [Casimicrobiaceae bacterium]|nr:DoxX family protein [Casimicrobiaceae bacterium]
MPASSSLSPTWTPRILSVLRIVAGFLFMTHGSAKILHFPEVAHFEHLPLFSLIGAAGLLELIGGALVMLGLFTRPAAFVLSGEMAFAYFIAHAPQAFLPLLNRGESAVLYCFLFLYLAFAGGGPWGIDALRRRPRGARA